MDFQKLLLKVSTALGSDEVAALAFLCTDFLNRNMNSVESASDLFQVLMDQDFLTWEQPELLTELLLAIQRPRLLRDVGLNDHECTTKSLISSYRKLLYSLSEEITAKELKSMKFILRDKLPRRKLEENVSTLAVFVEMENMALISETNLDDLEDIFKSVCPILNDKIHQFKALPVQEKSRPRSLSCPLEPKQASRQAGLSGMQELTSSSMNSSTSSIDIQKEAVTISRRTPSQENNVSPGNVEGLGTYKMTGAKRGTCVVVNNDNFTGSRVTLRQRKGTMVDEQSLKKVFEWLGFEVQIHQNCNRHKMMSVFSEVSRRDHSQVDCLVCCVLSHGLEGAVYGVDGQTVTIKELTDPFDGLNCPSLVNKPKLFFIQACQGNLEQRPVESDGHERGQICSDASKMKESSPSGADVLLGMATVPFHVSFRDWKSGTWYIQSLCQNLVELVPRGYDLVSILTKVNADVSMKSSGLKKQMPQPAFSLRNRVIFPIPDAPPPSLSI